MTCSFLTVHSLKCYCTEFIDNVELPWEQCGSDKSCEITTGMCYANLRITEQGVKHNFNCIEGDIENVVSSIRITCNTSPTDSQIVKCCNNTDFCNRDLNLILPTDRPPTQSPMATITPTSTADQGILRFRNVLVLHEAKSTTCTAVILQLYTYSVSSSRS